MKHIILIFTFTLLFNTSFVFAQEQPPRATPVDEQTLQPIQRTLNSQDFNPNVSDASNSMAQCVGSSALVGGVKSAIGSVTGSIDPTRVPTSNAPLEGKSTGTIATSFISWDQLGWCLVNSLIESISAATVAWINSGFQGNPAFVDDPAQFFTNLADYQAGAFLQELGGGFLCRPIQDLVRINIAQNYNQRISPFDQRAQCTFSGTIENMEQFMSGQNFSWNDWFSYTQNPYNNPMGASIYSNIELDRRIVAEANVEKTLLDWGRGFFSSRDQDSGRITSPGSVIESQVNDRLFSGQRRLEIADEFDEVVNALVNQLIKMAVSEMTQR